MERNTGVALTHRMGALPLAPLPVLAMLVQGCLVESERARYPQTAKLAAVDVLHGTTITDNYQWLEHGDDPCVQKWTEAQDKFAREFIDALPERRWLINRFEHLWRYDDEGRPREALIGDRVFFSRKREDDEKRTYLTRETLEAPAVELLNPNEWDETKSLAGTVPSRDGKRLAFGVADGGDEDARIRIMDVATKKVLPDRLKGWRQGVSSWLPDNSGFYYSAKPLKGEVPEGEEHYWHSAWFHKLGDPAEKDEKVFWHDDVKEYWHSVSVSEDGKYLLFHRGRFNRNDVWFKRCGTDDPLTPIVTNLDARSQVVIVNDLIFVRTNLDAPNEKVYVTDVEHPGMEHWKEFLPECADNLVDLSFVGGHVYATYLHNAFTVIKIYTLDGEYVRDMPLPGMGTANVAGYWSKPDVWVGFSSFTHIPSVYKYDFRANKLIVYHVTPIDIDVSDYVTTQVWYKSKDGTSISMFLIHRGDVKKNRRNPVLLTGYGGFNIPMRPGFASTYAVWLEAGGMVAVPNLRGGGEYGEDWHKAGMRENKQNVFDDFIAAAEWLIANDYTCPNKLAIAGGSNGGLLVSAVAVQRPELFKAVKCSMPLLDMVRYHKFGLANIWAEEYGTADDPDLVEYLLSYSPYHNVDNSATYPAILLIGSENDARTDPLHARKMAARMQEAGPDGNAVYLIVRKDSGHGGGVTLSSTIEQNADGWAFLMAMLGMSPPEL